MELLVFPQDEVPPPLKTQVLMILEHPWPSGRTVEERLTKPLHDPRSSPVCMLLVEEREVLSYLAVSTRAIEHAAVRYLASGLGSVATHPDHLRRGHGARLVSAAKARIEASDADFGIFTCDPPLVPFYTGQGWTWMPSTVVIGGTRAQPFRADGLGKHTLMTFCSDQARAHQGDFENADVYLDLREGDLW